MKPITYLPRSTMHVTMRISKRFKLRLWLGLKLLELAIWVMPCAGHINLEDED
jgi:hypothetical protein